MFLKVLSFFLPWSLRYRALNRWFHYNIHSGARIGYAWVFPKELIMDIGSKIDHFTVAIHLDKITMQKSATIGRSNWITGFPTDKPSKHFIHQNNRKAELIVGESSAITKKHHIDCTNLITIGRFSTIAGYQSQLLTHSIDVFNNRQHSEPIQIGDYTFIGTNVVILGGALLPDHSILAAKSLLNKPLTESWTIYGGIPAKALQTISKDAKYFNRKDGFVY